MIWKFNQILHVESVYAINEQETKCAKRQSGKRSKIPHEVQGYQIKQRAYGVDNQSTKEIKMWINVV